MQKKVLTVPARFLKQGKPSELRPFHTLLAVHVPKHLSAPSCRLSEDVGELDFTYDDTLLQADEEEEAPLSETLHKESQEPEVYCSGSYHWGPRWLP